MPNKSALEIEKILDSLIDELAAIEHDRWAHWQKYLHSKGIRQSDGALLIPSDLIQRWENQIDTSFEELSHDEKESDRDQVRKYLPTITRALSQSG